MKPTILALLLAGCAVQQAPAPTMPPECAPPIDLLDCTDSVQPSGLTFRFCRGANDEHWVFYPPEFLDGGWEHFDTKWCSVCRVWADGASVTGSQIADQTGNLCPHTT